MKNSLVFLITLFAVLYAEAQSRGTMILNKLNPIDNSISITDCKYEVITALFDIGIDTSVVNKNILWFNPKEVIDNIDNDGNGCIDDIHGVSFLANGTMNSALLKDTQIDSLKYRKLDTLLDNPLLSNEKRNYYLAQQKLELFKLKNKPKISDLASVHGTFVANLITKGNPKIKIMSLRFGENEMNNLYNAKIENNVKSFETSSDYGNRQAIEIIKEVQISIARSFSKVSKYLVMNNVKVVNLNINVLTKPEIRQLLSIKHIDSTEKETLVRQIFESWQSSITECIGNSPNILFVTTGCNSVTDRYAHERFPNGFNFPNLMTVGGVDSVGNITEFTSFDSKIDVYTNCKNIESILSGGIRKYSSASLATAQVTNLASKLLAIDSKLKPTQLIKIIINNSNKSSNGLVVVNSEKVIDFVRKNQKY
jgi:Subtilase family